MEYLFLLFVPLLQLAMLFGIIYTLCVIFRFGKIRDWFNKKAGEPIVTTFSFRSLRTLFITSLTVFPILIANLLFYGLVIGEETELTNMHIIPMVIVSFIVGGTYPAIHFIRRVKQCMKAENKKAARWRLIYDGLLNLAFYTGGTIVLPIMGLITVILSATKWSRVIPNKLKEMTGVEVAPASNNYYLIGVALGIAAVILQFIGGKNGESIVGGMLVIVFIGFALYLWNKVRKAAPEDKKQIAWQWGYMAVTTYIVFILTALVIMFVIALFILYIALNVAFNSGGGKGKYHVTCDNLTDDIINGRGICRLTNSRCEMRDTGVCPFK